MYKFGVDEMYENDRFIAKFECEYSRICLSCKSINFALAVKPTMMSLFWLFGLCLSVWFFGIYESSYAIIHKIGLYTKENILNFALSPLCLVYMEFLMPPVLKLGCKRLLVANSK